MLDPLQLHNVLYRQALALRYEPGREWLATNRAGRRVLLGRSLCDIEPAAAEAAGATTGRTKVITIRLTPQLRWAADLGARHQRRTMSGFIEWALSDYLHRMVFRGVGSMATIAAALWDVDEEVRFRHLAVMDAFQTRDDVQVGFSFTRGEMLFVNNAVIGHARTAFLDHPESERRRHLIRLWLREWGRISYDG